MYYPNTRMCRTSSRTDPAVVVHILNLLRDNPRLTRAQLLCCGYTLENIDVVFPPATGSGIVGAIEKTLIENGISPVDDVQVARWWVRHSDGPGHLCAHVQEMILDHTPDIRALLDAIHATAFPAAATASATYMPFLITALSRLIGVDFEALPDFIRVPYGQNSAWNLFHMIAPGGSDPLFGMTFDQVIGVPGVPSVAPSIDPARADRITTAVTAALPEARQDC